MHNYYNFGLPFRGPLYMGGGYSGPSVEEQNWLAEREAERQREAIRAERQLAEDEARRQNEEAEASAARAATEQAEELAAREATQEAMAQNASEAAAARSGTSDSSLSYRDVSLQAFQRGLIPDPDEEGRPE